MDMHLEACINLFVLLLFLAFWITTFFILYHLTRFGVGVFPKRLSALFLAGAALLSVAAFFSYAALDLSTLLR
jgi:hypothetical protein